MGSLLPGWDAAGNPPGFTSEETEETVTEPMGYFAKLERSRSSRPSDVPFVASLPHAYSLRRTSLPHDLVAEHAARTPASRERKEGKEHHSLSEVLARPSLSRPKGSGPRTDWAEELTTLGGSHKVEHTTPTKPGKKMVEEQRWSFARHMEHSVLNEPAAEADTAGGSTFTPQFGTAGNPSQFRSSAVEGH